MSRFIKSNKAGLSLLAVALVLIFLGVKRQEVAIVFTKAIRICLECIGIG